MEDEITTPLPGAPLEKSPAAPVKPAKARKAPAKQPAKKAPAKKAPAKRATKPAKKSPAKKPATAPRPASLDENVHGVKTVCTKKQFGVENCQCRKCAEERIG